MLRGRSDRWEHGKEVEDGPFVSFTDLLAGVLFMFLILVAALMLMQHDDERAEVASLQAELAKARMENGTSQSGLTTLQNENARMSARKAADRSTIEQLKAYSDGLQKQITAAQAALQKQVAADKMIADRLAADLTTAQQQTDDLRADFQRQSETATPVKMAFVYNEYQSERQEDGTYPDFKFVRTGEIYLSPDRKSWIRSEINEDEHGVSVGPFDGQPISRSEYDKYTCARSITRSQIKSECKNPDGSTQIYELTRTAADGYSGTALVKNKTGSYQWKVEYRLIKIVDTGFQ